MEFQLKKFSRVTIQMKTTEQYFPVVLFIMLYRVVLTFESVNEILWCDIQVKCFSSTFNGYHLFFSIFTNLNLDLKNGLWPFLAGVKDWDKLKM